MNFPSLTTILSVVFLGYMAHSLWSIGQLFFAPTCDPARHKGQCLKNHLNFKPERHVLLFSSLKGQPSLEKDLTFLAKIDVKNPEETLTEEVEVALHQKVKKNGTLYLAVFTVPWEKQVINYQY